MSLVFKVGDTVYHPTSGKGCVERVANSSHPYFIKYEGESVPCWSMESFLSYTPWPAPNYVRPIQEGLHIIKYDEQEYLAIWKDSRWRWALGDTFTWEGLEIMCANHVQSVKFLSELPKN